MAQKTSNTKCHVNLLNTGISSKYIISEDACPLGKPKKWLIKFGPKYELPDMEKEFNGMPMMVSLCPVVTNTKAWALLVLPSCS